MFDEQNSLKEFRYAEALRQEIKGFFVGSDLESTQEFIAKKGGPSGLDMTIASVSLRKEHLPAVGDIQPGIKHLLQVSTRSTLAQCGIETRIDWNQFGEEEWGKLRNGGSADLPIMVFNYGPSDVLVEKGDRMFRFFYPSGSRLERKDLAQTLKNGGITLSGVYGIDWWIQDSKGAKLAETEAEKGSSIAMMFDPTKRLFIPPNDFPLHLSDRKLVAEVLRPLPVDARSKFYTTRTNSKISVGEGFFGVIMTGIYEKTDQRHVESPLIDEGWGVQEGGAPIMVEIFDPAELSPAAPAIFLELFPKVPKREVAREK